jgi:hypothetical protein
MREERKNRTLPFFGVQEMQRSFLLDMGGRFFGQATLFA